MAGNIYTIKGSLPQTGSSPFHVPSSLHTSVPPLIGVKPSSHPRCITECVPILVGADNSCTGAVTLGSIQVPIYHIQAYAVAHIKVRPSEGNYRQMCGKLKTNNSI